MCPSKGCRVYTTERDHLWPDFTAHASWVRANLFQFCNRVMKLGLSPGSLGPQEMSISSVPTVSECSQCKIKHQKCPKERRSSPPSFAFSLVKIHVVMAASMTAICAVQ